MTSPALGTRGLTSERGAALPAHERHDGASFPAVDTASACEPPWPE